MRQTRGGQVLEASEYSRMFWWGWGASVEAASWAHFCGPSTQGQGKCRRTFSNNHNHLTKFISFSPQSSEKGSFHKWRNWCSSRLAPVLCPHPRSLGDRARIQTRASLTWKPEISPPHNTAWEGETGDLQKRGGESGKRGGEEPLDSDPTATCSQPWHTATDSACSWGWGGGFLHLLCLEQFFPCFALPFSFSLFLL